MQMEHATGSDLHIDPHILAEAAHWLTQMQDAPLDSIQQAQLEQWCHQSSDHQRAWQRAQRLLAKIGSLPPELAKPTLGRKAQQRHSRRYVLGSMASMLLLAPLGWLLWRHQPWHNWLATDYMALVGEQLDIVLEDGSQVSLNTDTALDVRFDLRQRLLHLRKGEIYVNTCQDRVIPARPFLVQTSQGQLLALGTRFSVRQMDGVTHLAVYEGAVQVCPADTAAQPRTLIVQAGQQAYFSRHSVEQPTVASEAIVAWRNHLLIADNMPVLQWAAELARYADQRIEVGHAARHLHISGAFPTNDLAHALQMLSDTHHVRVHIEGRNVLIGF